MVKFIISLLVLLPFLGTGNAKAQARELVVEISNIRDAQGQIALTLFASADGFPMQPEKAARHVFVPSKEGTVRIRLADLPFGTYAIAVLHDANRNERMDFNFLGMPKEGTGSSNDVRNLFSGPEFSQAKFEFRPGREDLSIRMYYWGGK
ncbi:MAG: DUF2141 domain-containing protein [Saprospiraceae bacterium]|nr:DUF2141 domain-containing protein [Saprospiraceae bacterium]MDP4820165.1 DUF2141 domain-containing protein [Saprospiraceae bacterium]